MTFPYLSLGCHNLTGGSSRWRSDRLVHCALDFGITRFDVAPSYGLGTAERTLSRALGKKRLDPSIEITTKYGLLPEPLGSLKALIREPARLIRRSVFGPPFDKIRATAPKPWTSAGSRVDPLKSLKRSLRALRVDRLGCLLTHERIHPDCRSYAIETLERLCREGVICKFGFSGARQAVEELLSVDMTAMGEPVVQVSIAELPATKPRRNLRIFNMSVIASRILANSVLRNSLCESLGSPSFANALAASLSFAHQNWADAIILVNASSDKRLEEVLSTLSDRRVTEWTHGNMTDLRVLAHGGSMP